MDIELFQDQLKKKTQEASDVVLSYLPGEEDVSYQRLVLEAMRYAIEAGGKRLRPMMMAETYHMFGGKSRSIEPFMAAIEYIHTYSLIHDDLPAMDNDDYRRGRLTTHKKYGEAMGILAGDALLNYAFETAAKAFLMEDDLTRVQKAFSVLAAKAGIFGMIGGQVVDVWHDKAGVQLGEDKVRFIYRLKTGALVEASMMIGAILAGASEEEVATIEKIAENVGLAFQIQDDILDITGNEEELGKPIGSDEKNSKETYVFFHGLDASAEKVKELSEEAVLELEGLNRQNDFLKALLLSLIHRTK